MYIAYINVTCRFFVSLYLYELYYTILNAHMNKKILKVFITNFWMVRRVTVFMGVSELSHWEEILYILC